ncbi:hypothetical protein [Streptomyces subrutilus]|uniref:hypothetical protein n=1 Tax=Streptomyces subrutilus TaxID=36818 RepID=UPI0033C4C80C
MGTALEFSRAGPAKVVTDRQIELLLKKQLAGTRSAAVPLTGLCDSSRCPPQAWVSS